jgi:two-component system sporulation sensor kinase A
MRMKSGALLDKLKGMTIFQYLIQNISEAVSILDLNGNIIFTNKFFEELTGYSRTEIFGKPSPFFEAREYQQAVSQVLSGAKLEKWEANIKSKENRDIFVRCSFIPLQAERGRTIALAALMTDISELRNKEIELNKAYRKLSDTIRNQQGMTFTFHKHNDRYIHTLCDGQLMSRLGFASHQVIGKDLDEFLPADMARNIRKYYDPAWQGEEVTYENTWHGITYFVKLMPVFENGKVIEVIGTSVDITERKKMEELLFQQKLMYQSLVDNALIGVFDWCDGRLEYANPKLAEIFGYSAEEMLRIEPRSLVADEDKTNLSMTVREYVSVQKEFNLTCKCLKKDNTIIHIKLQGKPIILNGKLHIIGMVQDETRENLYKNLAIESENRYQRILKLSPIPTILHDFGQIIYINKAGLEMLGAHNEEELLGKNLFDFICPEFHTVVKQRMEKVANKNKPLNFTEIRLKRMNRSIIDVEASAIYIYKQMNKPIIQSVFRDITSRKNTEHLLRNSEKLSIVGQLAAGVAHEIRNPLTALKGFSQLLMSKYPNDRRYLEILLEEVDRIAMIVNEFVVLAKPQAMSFKSKDIVELTGKVVSLLETQAILHNISIECEYNPLLTAEVRCDENQIRQVLINLIKNAIEAMPHGGVIAVQIEDMGECIRISVRDQGKGIPKEYLSKLGEPFFSTKENGTGLGLMICYQLIKQHNGRIEFESEDNQGTTVHITLPNSL